MSVRRRHQFMRPRREDINRLLAEFIQSNYCTNSVLSSSLSFALVDSSKHSSLSLRLCPLSRSLVSVGLCSNLSSHSKEVTKFYTADAIGRTIELPTSRGNDVYKDHRC